MKLMLVRHLWGVDLTQGLERYLPRWRDVGYAAIESAAHVVPDRDGLMRFLKQNGFALDSAGLQPGLHPRRHRSPAPGLDAKAD